MTSLAITAQGSTLHVGASNASAKTISAVQTGYPTIITSTAHGLVGGDVGTVTGLTGADAGLLNGNSLAAMRVTANTIALDVDTTGKTVTAGSGQFTPVTWVKVGGIKKFSFPEMVASEIDATNLDSTAKEILMGLPDGGTVTVDYQYIKTDPGQVAMRAANQTRSAKPYKQTLPDGTVISYVAYAKKIGGSGGVDTAVEGGMDLRVTGMPTFA